MPKRVASLPFYLNAVPADDFGKAVLVGPGGALAVWIGWWVWMRASGVSVCWRISRTGTWRWRESRSKFRVIELGGKLPGWVVKANVFGMWFWQPLSLVLVVDSTSFA